MSKQEIARHFVFFLTENAAERYQVESDAGEFFPFGFQLKDGRSYGFTVDELVKLCRYKLVEVKTLTVEPKFT